MFVAGHFSSEGTALCEQGINYHRLEFHFHWRMYTIGDKWDGNVLVAVNRASVPWPLSNFIHLVQLTF